MQDLFSKNILECFPNGTPDALSTEGGSLWYLYQEAPKLIVLFSPFGTQEENYLQGIYGAVELLFAGKQTITLDDIKAVFGADITAEQNPMEGGMYTAVYADGFTILFQYDDAQATVCSFFKMKATD